MQTLQAYGTCRKQLRTADLIGGGYGVVQNLRCWCVYPSPVCAFLAEQYGLVHMTMWHMVIEVHIAHVAL